MYYSVSDCLVTLTQLNYASDVYSSDTLRQVVSRLPHRLQNIWAERSLSIRTRGTEPNLIDLESWLQVRVLALKERYHSEKKPREEKSSVKSKEQYALKTDVKTISCSMCDGKHLFWKCDKYAQLENADYFKLAKKLQLSYNCLRDGHKTKDCSSQVSCPHKNCTDRHHSTLHEFFASTNKQNKTNELTANNNDQVIPDETEMVVEPPANNNQISMMKIDNNHPKVAHTLMVKSEVRNVYLWVVPVTIRSLEGVS